MIELVRTLDQHYHVCKSLSQVKQQILESLAWTGDSPLWEEIQANGGRFPLIQQVDTDRSDLTCFHLLVSNRMSGLCSSFQQSSVLESLVLYAGDATKFPWKSCTSRLRLSPTTRSSKSVAKTLGFLCTLHWRLNSCSILSDRVSLETCFSSNDDEEHSTTVNKAEKNNFLHQFSRMVSVVVCLLFLETGEVWCSFASVWPQVYTMTAARLEDLGSKLKLSGDLRKSIWTCFENSLVQHPRLMVNHHLDQLLFSSIYITAQVSLDFLLHAGERFGHKNQRAVIWKKYFLIPPKSQLFFFRL